MSDPLYQSCIFPRYYSFELFTCSVYSCSKLVREQPHSTQLHFGSVRGCTPKALLFPSQHGLANLYSSGNPAIPDFPFLLPYFGQKTVYISCIPIDLAPYFPGIHSSQVLSKSPKGEKFAESKTIFIGLSHLINMLAGLKIISSSNFDDIVQYFARIRGYLERSIDILIHVFFFFFFQPHSCV